jgi:hypothetical protein
MLAGCLDLDQKITLVKDQLTYKAELKLDAKIAAFADKSKASRLAVIWGLAKMKALLSR